MMILLATMFPMAWASNIKKKRTAKKDMKANSLMELKLPREHGTIFKANS
jgi:hypothetical protein